VATLMVESKKVESKKRLNPKNLYKIFCQNLAILDGNAVVIASQNLKMLQPYR